MDQEILNTINQYKKNLEALGIRAKKIIIYGSYASGDAKTDSDLDLLVLSNDLKNMDLWERLCILGRARQGIKRPMEILGMTEEEYETEHSIAFIRDEVKAKGIEII